MLSLPGRWATWSTARRLLIILAAALALGILYLWRLGYLTPGLSPAEAAARSASLNFHSISSSPIDAPQRLLQYALQALGHHGAFWMRLPSVAFAILFLVLFYFLVKNWFGRLVGILAVAILATTPWIILIARSSTADIMLLAPIAILLAYDRLSHAGLKHRDLAWIILVIAVAVSLYVPGIIWIVLAGGILCRQKLSAFFKTVQQRYRLPSLGLALLIILPLIIACVQMPSLLETLFLWPQHWLSWISVLKDTAWSALALLWRLPYHINTAVGRLAVLDAPQIALALFGVFAMWSKARRELYVIAAFTALGVLSAGLNHNLLLLTLALPSIVILDAAGLRYLYVEWRSVFPNNPIPRALALVLMVVLVALHVLFGVRYSLVAWPHTVATHQDYVIK